MKRNTSGRRRLESPSPWFNLFLLAFFFSIGLILGQVFAGKISPSARMELHNDLQDFLQIESGQLQGTQIFSTALLLYLKYPLAAFLLGYTVLGIFFLPGAAAVYGFLLSFSVSCFMISFEENSLFLALAAFGTRALFTVPCFFLIALLSMERSGRLLAAADGRQSRDKPEVKQRGHWVILSVCMGLLVLGAYLEMKIGPVLLKSVLQYFLVSR